MLLSTKETQQLRSALQDAVIQCSERGLYQSAKWAAELLTSIPASATGPETDDGPLPPSVLFSQNVDPKEARLEAAETSKYLLAKSFFDCREYDRCAAVFLPDSLLAGVLLVHQETHGDPAAAEPEYATAGILNDDAPKPTARRPTPLDASPVYTLPEISQRSLFLALYAKLLSGEKRKDEEVEMVMGPHDTGEVRNRQLRRISVYLQAWFDRNAKDEKTPGTLGTNGTTGTTATPEDGRVDSQGWLDYLYGMVLAKEKNEEEAMEWFIRSVHRYPMNWGCWLEMASLMSRVDELNKTLRRLPQNITSYIFHVHTSLELFQQNSNLAASLEQLMRIFPTSAFLLTCSAMLAYHSKDLALAEDRFNRVLTLHPHRLDSLDHFSNILYVLNNRPRLGFLAHLCTSVDRFRAETCVVTGNYYSLLSAHEKAVSYFRRALYLDRTCLSAWTLMGHEYVELKNTHAAIESYRRAVDANRRDYRAWYGLGQAYEVLEMHTYALYYYKKAAGLRPWDGKMWLAIGSCLQKNGRPREGIKALKRALMADANYDPGSGGGGRGGPRSDHYDPDVLLQIATLYEKLGSYDEAKSYMELCLAQEEGELARHMARGTGGDDDGDGGDGGDGERTGGTGVTPATCKARLWLANAALDECDFSKALVLAQELCHDGVDVEEAKALVKKAEEGMVQQEREKKQKDAPVPRSTSRR